MLRGHTGASWCLFLLVAVTPGVHLQRPDPDVHTYQPVLRPSVAVPKIGTYMVISDTGKPCIKTTMGAQFIITEKKKTWYLNLDPSMVVTSGYCGNGAAGLSLTRPGNTTSLQFTFRKERKVVYISTLTAHVSSRPVCQGCADKTYSGVLDHVKLFSTTDGHSFKCISENLLVLSSELKVKLVPLQVQAFTLLNGLYGEEDECWADFNKEVVPIILGAVVVGLVLTALLTHLFIRDRRRQGYSRI